jgi:GT2 family glycosyltransferase
MTDISIIISFYDNRKILALCLSQMQSTLCGYDTEVIVVDDNPDRLIDRSKLTPKWVRLIRSPVNLGYSGACNLGSDAARGKYLLFVDSDIVPTTRWLGALLRLATRKPNFGAIAAKTLDLASGTIAHYGAAIHGVDSIHPYLDNDSNYHLASRDQKFQLLPSSVLLMRREIFVELGKFDTSLLNCFGDFDLSMKLYQAGLTSWVSAGSIAFHRGSVSGDVRYS